MSESKKVVIKKATSRERIEVSISEFKGKQFLDIRNFYLTEDDEWKPSPKGISIPVELSRKVFRSITKVAGDFFDEAPVEEAIAPKKKKGVEAVSKKKSSTKADTKPKKKIRPTIEDDDEEELVQKPKKSLKKKKKG